MASTVAALALGAVAVLHLLPLAGALGGERLAALYGVPADEPTLALLLRHRAVLFGLLGGFLLVAACRPLWRTPAFVAGFVSVASFLWLAALVGPINAQLSRVVVADVVALGCLAIGAVAHHLSTP
jgi:hypothetical protein